MGLVDPWHTWPCIWLLFILCCTHWYSEQCLNLFYTFLLPGLQKKKMLSTQHFYSVLLPKAFHIHSCGVQHDCCFIAHSNTIQQSRQDARQAILYAAERTREVSVNRCNYQMWTLAKKVRGNTLLRSAIGSLMPPKSLQSWHHLLLEMEPLGPWSCVMVWIQFYYEGECCIWPH